MRLQVISRTLTYSLPAVLSLLIQIQFFGPAQPPVWPDEVLFSSPAYALSSGDGFKTEVLEGLVPGMEKATLWNSPLYMVVLSGFYSFSGESLEVGRTLSFLIGAGILILIAYVLLSMGVDLAIVWLAPLLISLDPSFVRGSNVIRMDGLCLLFCMLTLWYCYLSHKRKKDHLSFLAGLFLGLGALSHPAALYGTGFVILFHLFRWRGLFFAGCGAVLALSPWLAYIAQYPDIFEIQFLSQLMRKSGLLSLWGGPTGGIFVVFTSQFGGGALSMVLVGMLCLLASLQLLLVWYRWISMQGQVSLPTFVDLFRSNGIFLISLSWPLVTAFCLLSVEGWYAMHSFPYLVLSAAALFSVPYRLEMIRKSGLWLMRSFAIAMFLIAGLNAYRHLSRGLSMVVDRSLQTMLEETQSCKSIYVRMVPDPYFVIRAARPDVRYFEFVPSKLSFPFDSVQPEKVYQGIHCFLLEGSGQQSGPVDQYLARHSSEFRRRPLAFSSPARAGNLYIRIEQ